VAVLHLFSIIPLLSYHLLSIPASWVGYGSEVRVSAMGGSWVSLGSGVRVSASYSTINNY